MKPETTERESPITIREVEGLELHLQYPGQHSVQNCHVCLDTETGELWAEADEIIGGGAPENVWHGIVRRWRISEPLKADAANALLEEIAPAAERIYYDSERVFDGHNQVCRMGEDALEAKDEIEATIRAHEPWSEYERVNIWDACDWFAPCSDSELGISAATTDAQLSEIVKREEERASEDGVDALEGTEEYLTSRRDRAFADLAREVDAASEYVHVSDELDAWLRAKLLAGAEEDADALAASLDAEIGGAS